MTKDILAFVLLVAWPAFSQISSGTSIVITLTNDELVVAADSRSVEDGPGSQADNSYCKIAVLHHQFIFTSVGAVRFRKASPASTVESWDNAEAARDALKNATNRMIINDAYMDAVLRYWAQIVENHWNTLCRLERSRCMNEIMPTGPFGLLGLGAQRAQMTAGILVGARGLFAKAATIDFDSDWSKAFNPIDHNIVAVSQCRPCGQGEQVCAAGSHVDVAAQFCSDRKPGTKPSVRSVLTKADDHAKLAVELVEKTIDAYERTAGDVGGPVDAVTITKDGSITWNSRKTNCPENQD